MISSVSRSTTSFSVETQVFGREKEQNELMRLLFKSADGSGSSRNSLSVLAIVGIGGVGKTTLAQQVYNDKLVADYFELKVWVCVSENFCVERLTKEIIQSATRENCDLMNFDTVQVVVKEEISSKRFLLVLDDVWNVDIHSWESLFAPLRSGAPGSKILVTTRSRKIVDMIADVDAIHLNCLDELTFWEFFKKCAFGSQNSENYPQLEAVGEKIARKLNGLPLAARTLGGLLNMKMDEKHWKTIMESEIWQLPFQENSVLPILHLSYQCLPAHLKRCFAFCSLFPKDFKFLERDLVVMWMAEGFVASQGSILRMEDAGSNYFHELVSRSFFQKTESGYYVMHGLIHDLAQLISVDECYRLEDGNSQDISSMLRHLSVFGGDVDHKRLLEFSNYNKLRTLMLPWKSRLMTCLLTCHLFEGLKNIRVLILRGCGIKDLPESVGDLIHLCYLDISFNYDIEKLPESVCGLYNMQTLRLTGCGLEIFPQGINKLINLRQIDVEGRKILKINGIGKLTSLQELSHFRVLKYHGHKLAELNGLIQLRGRLRISKLENIESREEAREAKLHNKIHLDELHLEWSSNQVSSFEKNELHALEELLEDLQPHPNLKTLIIRGYPWAAREEGDSWAEGTKMFPCLRSLNIEKCPKIKYLPPLPPSLVKLQLLQTGLTDLPRLWKEKNETKCLSELCIFECPNLTSLEGLLSQLLPTIKVIRISECKELVWLPMQRFKELASLEDLLIKDCPKLMTMAQDEHIDFLLPSSIKQLELSDCGNLGKSLPGCLHSLTSLATLRISNCSDLTSLPSEPLLHLKEVECLSITGCGELRSIDGLGVLKSLKSLTVIGCPKINFPTEGDEQEEGLSLSELVISDTALLHLPSLRSALPFIRDLTITSSSQAVMFEGEEEELLRGLADVRELKFFYCENLKCLPTELHAIPSLQRLWISDCPEMQALPEKGLPASLTNFFIDGCHPMLTEQLQKHLTAMNSSAQ